jgi:hypothetical protein
MNLNASSECAGHGANHIGVVPGQNALNPKKKSQTEADRQNGKNISPRIPPQIPEGNFKK